MGELYLKYEYSIAALQLGFAMLGMGATLTTNDFKKIILIPRSVLIGVGIQLILVPLIAFSLISSTTLTAGIVIGLALIAAIPGGTTSNIFTYFAHGNVPLSISITGLTTLACLASTPIILSLLVSDYLPADFIMPTGQIVFDIAFTLLLPLLAGMLILHYLSKHAAWISKWSIRLSLMGILLIIIGSSSAGRLDLSAFGTSNILIVVSFILLLTLITLVLSKALRLSRPDSSAISMEVVVRNVNLAVLIKVSMFPNNPNIVDNSLGDQVLFTILLYGALQMIISIVLIVINRQTRTSI